MPTDLPRFVPTLTEVIDARAPSTDVGSTLPQVAMSRHVPETPAEIRDERRVADDLAEQIAHRVLQRVDAVLAERLSEAIRDVVEQHTRALLPAIREEIVVAVHATVAEALADEFLKTDGTT